MKNKCIARIKRDGMTKEQVSKQFHLYVSLQEKATVIAADIGELITNRVNDYERCECSFDIEHDNWNVVSKTCFELGVFFGMYGLPIEFDVSDASPTVLASLKKYFDKSNYGPGQIAA